MWRVFMGQTRRIGGFDEKGTNGGHKCIYAKSNNSKSPQTIPNYVILNIVKELANVFHQQNFFFPNPPSSSSSQIHKTSLSLLRTIVTLTNPFQFPYNRFAINIIITESQSQEKRNSHTFDIASMASTSKVGFPGDAEAEEEEEEEVSLLNLIHLFLL